MLPQNITLHSIAQKFGVGAERVPSLIEAYKANRHNPTLLLECISQFPNDEEKRSVLAFVGAVITGAANDPNLYPFD